MSSSTNHRVVGKRSIRKDGVAKVTGKEMYASDMSVPTMLHARVLKSTRPHARVRSIDSRGAERLGATVVTFMDVPQVRFCPRLVSTPEATYKDWTVLTDRPLYVGDPIAAVAAESEDEAQKALEAIRVDFEDLESYLDPVASMNRCSTRIHESILLNDKEITLGENVACQLQITEGDVESGFRQSDIVLERIYKTNRRYHNQLETKSVVVRPEADGGISLWCTTQTIHNTRLLLHEIFGIPASKIRVFKVALGGSFGSSIQTNTIVPIAVALALKARRAVRLAYTREEDMHDHCSYEMVFRLKLGASSDGIIRAGELQTILDIGAHQVQAYPLLGCIVGWWVSLYRLPALRYHGRAVYTNKVPSCAFRGYGNPQISWAVESMVDELAEKLGLDPLEFRLKNYVGKGDVFWGQGPTVKSIIQSCGVEEILRKGAGMIGWNGRRPPGRGRYRSGIGLGRGFHTSSAGAAVPGTVIDYSGALLKVNEDGTLDYVTAMMDHGGGTLEAHAKIIAEELNVPLDNVSIVVADTQTTVYDVNTHASRGVYAGGGVAQRVAREVKAKTMEFAARILDAYPHALKTRVDETQDQCVIYVEGVKGKETTLREVASTARHKNWGTIAAVESLRQGSCPPHFTGYFVEVEVDTETGKVKPTRVVAGADVGTVINPDLAAGQIHGGFAMGWSMAILEDTPYDTATGDLASHGYLTDYKTPTTADMPSLEDFKVFFAETYEPTGPFGAKGLGEGALNPVAGAVANAVYNAIGIRFYELPITPSKVVEALRAKEAG